MKRLAFLISYCLALLSVASANAQISIGAAPEGDSKIVASRIIKYNFPDCRRVSSAVRLRDGSIQATCDGITYRVCTMYSAKQGKMLEVALNCTAAKRLLNIDC